MSNRFQFFFWSVVALALAAWAWQDFSAIKVALAVLAAIYGVLHLLKHRLLQRGLELSAQEIAVYESQLIEATPLIVELINAHVPVRDIARQVEERFGLPQDVTLRYIIALGRYHPETG